MKQILILGGTGAMGEYLVNILSRDTEKIVYVTSRKEHKDFKNIHYLIGNARDYDFLNTLLSNKHFDTIIDFMNYGFQEFQNCHQKLLNATNHYIFLSSSRVYANSSGLLKEDCPRLLDVTEDTEFLKTQRYALRKARQENMLFNSGKNNFTIVRPYITYSNRRLQLGVYEKEDWLYRVLNGKAIIISDGILKKKQL